jgi:hypothetical protein
MLKGEIANWTIVNSQEAGRNGSFLLFLKRGRKLTRNLRGRLPEIPQEQSRPVYLACGRKPFTLESCATFQGTVTT